MSLLPLSQPIGRVWLRAGFEKRESIKSSEEGRENMCRFCYLNHPAPYGTGCRYSCRVLFAALQIIINLSWGITKPSLGGENSL